MGALDEDFGLAIATFEFFGRKMYFESYILWHNFVVYNRIRYEGYILKSAPRLWRIPESTPNSRLPKAACGLKFSDSGLRGNGNKQGQLQSVLRTIASYSGLGLGIFAPNISALAVPAKPMPTATPSVAPIPPQGIATSGPTISAQIARPAKKPKATVA